MKNEKHIDDSIKLLLAMGEIDDNLIEEARYPHPIFFTIKRTGALVASLIVVMIVSIAAITLVPTLAPAGNSNAENNTTGDAMSGTAGSLINAGSAPIANGGSNISFISNDNSRYSFLLNLDGSLDDIDLYIYGSIRTSGGTLQDVVITTGTVPEGYNSFDIMPELKISYSNSKEQIVDEIPTAAGSYMLSFDLSDFDSSFIIDSIQITPFDAEFNPN